MPILHIFYALFVVACWGTNFTMIKLSMGELTPLMSAALRFFLAAVPLIFFIPKPTVPWGKLVAYALMMGTALYALLNLALNMGLSASLASLVLQVQALFTIIIAVFVFKDIPRAAQIVGMTIALAGIGIIAYGHGLSGDFWPLMLILIAAVCWAIANNVTKSLGNIPMLSYSVWGNFIASIPLFVLSVVFEGGFSVFEPVFSPSLVTALSVAFMAYPATLVGFFLWSYLISKHSAATIAPFSLLVPIAGMTSGVLILGEHMQVVDIVGGVFVLIGLAFTVIRFKAKPLLA